MNHKYKDKPIKVLYINGGTMDYGGISSYMMNYYRHFDKSQIHIDFAVHGKDKGRYDNEIIQAKSQIYRLPDKRKNFFAWKSTLTKLFLYGNYKIVHSHADGMNGYILKQAAKCNIPVRISHSHNTSHLTDNKMRLLLHEHIKKQIPKYATHLWACSEAAGKWLYGNNRFTVIPNAIDIKKYKYNKFIRKDVRRELGVENNFVVGNIGKLEYQKNHEYLIGIFEKLFKNNPSVKLLLIGDGSRMLDIKQLSKARGVYEHVIFLGHRNDAERLYNAMDCFVMPSRFEGLPVTAIEAQANGLTCFFSDTITREVKIINNTCFLPIDVNTDVWSNQILSSQYVDREQDNTDLFKKKRI